MKLNAPLLVSPGGGFGIVKITEILQEPPGNNGKVHALDVGTPWLKTLPDGLVGLLAKLTPSSGPSPVLVTWIVAVVLGADGVCRFSVAPDPVPVKVTGFPVTWGTTDTKANVVAPWVPVPDKLRVAGGAPPGVSDTVSVAGLTTPSGVKITPNVQLVGAVVVCSVRPGVHVLPEPLTE